MKFMHWTTGDWINLATNVVAGATAARIGLYWMRQGLAIWIAPTSGFWSFYDKLELTLAYLAGSLTAFGKKKAESELTAPVAKSLSPGEGQLKP